MIPSGFQEERSSSVSSALLAIYCGIGQRSYDLRQIAFASLS